MQKYYQNEPKFNGVYSRNNLSQNIKVGTDEINLDEYADGGIIGLLCFGVEHVSEEIKKFIGNKSTETNIFSIQANDSIIPGYFCVEFIDFMPAGKFFIEYTSRFSPYDLKKNDDIILSYFKNEWSK